MFGWEFPPFKSGGLGTACRDLVKGLVRNGTEVTFVMPTAPAGAHSEGATIIGADNFLSKVKVRKVRSTLGPYQTARTEEEHLAYIKKYGAAPKDGVYGKNLHAEVDRYALCAFEIAREEPHDIIHAHDWMTYQAGINARQTSGKPLVVHIHATEFDRTGGNPNSLISHTEWLGLTAADLVIANSNLTKQNVMKHYLIPEDKIKVVHWGIEADNPAYGMGYRSSLNENDKIVLFLGRVTIQKGPDYFVEAARRALDYVPEARFVVAGDGDMLPRMIHRVGEMGIADKFLFTGFLRGDDVHRAFQMADLYVMPSVSEPFGLVALEAMRNNTPVLISKQSGVAEVINNALKVDFWDVDEMTNKIVGVLRHSPLREELRDNGHQESGRFNLDEPARKTMQAYNEAWSKRAPACA